MKQFGDNKEEGFTLVEVVIVIAIIGILVAIAIPQFAAYRVRAYNSSAMSDAVNIQRFQAMFFAEWKLFGHTDVAAAATGANNGLLLSGTGGAATGIAGSGRFMQISISTGVNVVAHTDATARSFTTVAKHTQGVRFFGVDSDASGTYYLAGTAGTAMVMGNAVAATSGINDLASAGYDSM